MYSRKLYVYIVAILLVLAVGVRTQLEQFLEPDSDAGLAGDAKHDSEVKLRKALTKNYAVDVLPPHNSTNPIVIQVGLSVIAILDLDAQKQILTTEGWMKLMWNDSRLAWNPDKYDGLEIIRIDQKFIWKPDIVLYNGVQGIQGKPESDVLMLIYSHGEIVWIPPLSFKSHCPVDLKYYPYDQHSCYLKFGSWTHNGFEINITLPDKGANPDFADAWDENGEWDIVGGSGKRTEKIYPCCKEPYPDVTYTIDLRRRSPFYKVAILCPVVSAVLLMMTSFWMSPVARKRITLNISSLFLLVGTVMFLISRIPAVGHHIPVIVVICGVLIISTVLMTVGTILFSTIARNRRNQPVSSRIRSITASKLAAILLVPQPKSFDSLSNAADTEEGQSNDEKVQGGSTDTFNQWISFFQFLDRIFFVIFTFVIVIMLIASST